MATDKFVVVSFDAGKIERVTKKLREQFPNAVATFCADNDHQHTRRTPEGMELWNKVVALVQDVARAVDGKAVVPSFTDEERFKGLTNFNDLHQTRGLDEEKLQVGLFCKRFSTFRLKIKNAEFYFE